MANQNDSFIDEVTEDLRRDRLFNAMRRYGWIVILLIMVAVAAAAWREYARAQATARAQEFGDALMAALDSAPDDPAARAVALAKVDDAGAEGRAAVRDLLTAAAQAEAGDAKAAADWLSAAADGSGGDPVTRELARLKTVMVLGKAMDPARRDATLAELSAPGAPFELLALEQKAVALIDAGRPEDAVALIRQIQQKDGLTESLRRRLAEMMITLGAEPEPSADLPGQMSDAPATN